MIYREWENNGVKPPLGKDEAEKVMKAYDKVAASAQDESALINRISQMTGLEHQSITNFLKLYFSDE